MKVGQVVGFPSFQIHSDDDPKESADLWHAAILAALLTGWHRVFYSITRSRAGFFGRNGISGNSHEFLPTLDCLLRAILYIPAIFLSLLCS